MRASVALLSPVACVITSVGTGPLLKCLAGALAWLNVRIVKHSMIIVITMVTAVTVLALLRSMLVGLSYGIVP